MAKLTTFFFLLCALLAFVHISAGLHITRRDVDSSSPTQKLSTELENVFTSVKKQIEQTFTQENLDELKKQFEVLGEKIKTASADLGEKLKSSTTNTN